MSLMELKEQQTNLLLQRSSAKDAVEQLEKVLAQVGFAIKVLEEAAKEPVPTPE